MKYFSFDLKSVYTQNLDLGPYESKSRKGQILEVIYILISLYSIDNSDEEILGITQKIKSLRNSSCKQLDWEIYKYDWEWLASSSYHFLHVIAAIPLRILS